MSISSKKHDLESCAVESRLRDEVFLLDPWHRESFALAVFDSRTNALHGTKYSLYFHKGRVSIR